MISDRYPDCFLVFLCVIF